MPFILDGKLTVHGSPAFRSIINKVKDDSIKIAQVLKEYNELRNYLYTLPADKRLGIIFDLMEKNRTEYKTSCKAGCAHCCYMKVEISNEEADLLIALIKRDRININKEHLKQQMQLTENDFWSAPRTIARCIFLGKNNQCKVYKFRPRPCRNHSVTSSPEDCKTKPGENHKIAVVADYKPELISSAYITTPGIKAGGMAEMLYTRL